MNQSVKFISDREQIASEFASEVESRSSYLMSSRHRYSEEVSEAENDLIEFQGQIQYKFIRSVANKIYTFPVSSEAFDLLTDQEEFKELLNRGQYNLYEQNINLANENFTKPQVKPKTIEIKSQSAHILIESMNHEIDRLEHLKSFVQENFQTKRKTKLKNQNDFMREGYDGHCQVIKEEPSQDNTRMKRLQTQPYEKPQGFIIKRK